METTDIKYKQDVKWIRAASERGMQSIGTSNDLRSWTARVGLDQEIGVVYNDGALATNLGGNPEARWRIMFYTSKGTNIIISANFATDKVEDAKAALERVYLRALDGSSSNKELCERIKKFAVDDMTKRNSLNPKEHTYPFTPEQKRAELSGKLLRQVKRDIPDTSLYQDIYSTILVEGHTPKCYLIIFNMLEKAGVEKGSHVMKTAITLKRIE